MSETEKTKRPAQEDRRAAILEAAAAVFLERGYAAASIDAVIERVGGSKRNIYTMFGGKEALFSALVLEKSQQLFDPLWAETPVKKNLDETLFNFARLYMTIIMSPRTIAIFRVAIAEAQRMPQLARAFHRNGPERGITWLENLLRDAMTRGEISVDDPKEAAQRFLGIVRSNRYMEIVLGLSGPLEPEEIKHSAKSAVKLFLNGVGTAAPPPPEA